MSTTTGFVPESVFLALEAERDALAEKLQKASNGIRILKTELNSFIVDATTARANVAAERAAHEQTKIALTATKEDLDTVEGHIKASQLERHVRIQSGPGGWFIIDNSEANTLQMRRRANNATRELAETKIMLNDTREILIETKEALYDTKQARNNLQRIVDGFNCEGDDSCTSCSYHLQRHVNTARSAEAAANNLVDQANLDHTTARDELQDLKKRILSDPTCMLRSDSFFSSDNDSDSSAEEPTEINRPRSQDP
ncbi:hypothetical protein K504DRAFT_466102 [Pleomassaria siparia CBS 279.74]|uniref:Uncharacterized protein n=1 Tax=Pleomassaria siparia CBS 279.74 TaxID=1314801 RepID=A0A6G1KFE3_9PLEO|nr:hypothetical protein K504DRAFT_466102 [Pleomassaria siparia CBS 279.74]